MNRRTVKDIVKLVGPLPFQVIGKWTIQLCNYIKGSLDDNGDSTFIPLSQDLILVTSDLNLDFTELEFQKVQGCGGIKFFSPEHAKDEKTDKRTTMYLLGSMLYEFCTGKEPFTSTSESELLLAHMRVTAPKLNAFRFLAPDSLTTIVSRLLMKAPDDRLSTTDEIVSVISKMPLSEDPTGENAQNMLNELFGRNESQTAVPKVTMVSSPSRPAVAIEKDPEMNRATLRMKVPVFSGPPEWEKTLSLNVHTGKAVFRWNTAEPKCYTCKVALTESGKTIFHSNEDCPAINHEITVSGLSPGTNYTASIYGDTEFVMRKFKTPVTMV